MRIIGALIVLGALAIAGCDDDDDILDGLDDADIADDEGEARGEALAAQTETMVEGVTPEEIAAMSGAIMIAIDQGEVLQAQFAVDNARQQVVVDFANEMIDVHTDHIAATEAQLDALGLAPQDNDIAVMLRDEAMAGLVALQRVDDDDVDFAYMRMQVVMHAEAFVLVGTLQRLAPFDELAAFFAETQTVIAAHRDEAAAILRDL